MVRKKIDSRIRSLIEAGVNRGHRSLFVVVGDHGRDQIVHLHYMLSKSRVGARPSILWCYRNDLGFSSDKKKRLKHMKKKKFKTELVDGSIFDQFLMTTEIRYCYYKETDRILGNTFGMCVLQDFEALTPNLLARTIETVQGGGIIVILLKSLTSLRQLYTMSMDIHDRYRTESEDSGSIVARFNERFLLSLSDCKSCLIMDEKLDILSVFQRNKNVAAESSNDISEAKDEVERGQIEKFSESFSENKVLYPLVSACKSLDQSQIMAELSSTLSSKNTRVTVSVTAARGRGKSAVLGFAIAAAIVYGYSNVFVTSPHPSNLNTLFLFILKGFDKLGYMEHQDYEILRSESEDVKQVVMRINIFKSHRQTVQYVRPEDSQFLNQAELVVIDEAAAIPLPIVKSLLGSYLVFMASTINGYEGTGRSLSLKLLDKLRKDNGEGKGMLKELVLESPIRYSRNDPVEQWLNKLLCFNTSLNVGKGFACPNPEDCNLYYVNRDTLYSYHKASETFLQKMMSLYVASHYKNTPNDIQLMSDAPNHHLFVLLPPLLEDNDRLPEILVVLQVCVEGRISRECVLQHNSRGMRGSGNLIPWTVSQQFQDEKFAHLSGVRIVRIATHPNFGRMGYGTRAVKLLEDFYFGRVVNSLDSLTSHHPDTKEDENIGGDLYNETITPRQSLPPLLSSLDEVVPEKLDWMGVSFGMTQDLLRFWKRNKYVPVYLRQTSNELTGEYTIIMLKKIHKESEWCDLFFRDFYKRFVGLLSFRFRLLASSVALEIMNCGDICIPAEGVEGWGEKIQSWRDVFGYMSMYDLKRLDVYSNNMVDHHLILDLVPYITRDYFTGRMGGDVFLSPVQSSIMLSIGFQHKNIEEIESELNIKASQVLAIFAKIIRKAVRFYKGIKEASVSELLEKELDKNINIASNNQEILPLEEELEEMGRSVLEEMKKKQKSALRELETDEYKVRGTDEDWDSKLGNMDIHTQTIVSIEVKNKNTGIMKEIMKKHTVEENKKKKRGLTSLQ